MQNRNHRNSKPYKQYNITAKVIFLCIVLVNITYHTYSQSNNTIFKNYKKIEIQKIDSVIGFNHDDNRLKYLAVLPNLTYDAKNNSFGVGVSLSNLSNYFQTKQRNKIELEKLRFQLLDAHNATLQNLTSEYELVINTYELLLIELNNNKLSQEIFNLKKSQYDNNKINLETWLMVQNEFQNKNLLLFAKRKNLITKMKQFEQKIKSPCFGQELLELSINCTNQ